MTYKAYKAIGESQVIVGYTTYIKLIEEIITGQQVISTGMTKERDRSEQAVAAALEGKSVAVISSGDAGVYGMAGIILELLLKKDGQREVDVEVVPGVTAANAAAAVLGAPLMHDYLTVSLSNLLTPWEKIRKRVKAAAESDCILAIYNPKSKKRTWQIEEVQQILLEHKSPEIPVGIVKNACRDGERVELSTLGELTKCEIDMFSLIIVGNEETFKQDNWLITPRGYNI
ncbi:precorrin-3B C17-methyltransferase [Desulfitispora alkaliphila]|uniref:precorrin-3B C(17)-methyltransferase n=1 Tax=Desulfitispora alkaliphila TaxID=622674 RepID=UPI003D201099